MCHRRLGADRLSHVAATIAPGLARGTAGRLITNKGTGSIHLRARRLAFSQLAVHSRDDVCHLETHDWTTE